jgi:predicted acyl esterase
MVFFKGHRIRLEVSSSSFPRFDINPNTGKGIDSQTNAVAVNQTIWRGSDHPSLLVLPIIPHP